MTTWTPVALAVKIWSALAQQPARTFSPHTFSRRPVFDTGSTAGTWDANTKPASAWTVKP